MAKLQNLVLLRNKKGQSVVEYILLLAVLSSLSFALYNSTRFKSFIKGDVGFFDSIRKRMEYSYRYGRELNGDVVDYDSAMEFSYGDNKHDTYYNQQENSSRFFAGQDAYPK